MDSNSLGTGKRLGSRFLFWENHHEILRVFFLGGGKTKKKTLAVSLPPFFCDFHISEKSVLLGDQLSYEMRGRCILRIKWLCGSAFLSTDG